MKILKLIQYARKRKKSRPSLACKGARQFSVSELEDLKGLLDATITWRRSEELSKFTD